MATAYVTFGRAATTKNDQPAPVYLGGEAITEAVTTSGTSAQSAAAPTSATVVTVFSSVAHVAAVGSNPTASATVGRYVPANFLVDIAINSGDKVALITV